MSNFQEARNLEGQKNAKGYQQGVSMTGTVQALIDPTRIFTTNGKPTQRIQLLDALGESLKVKVFLGNGPDILPTDVGTQQSFTDLAMNRYKGNISYMAFWDNMHPPQGQPQSTQLNAATQAIINSHRPPTAGQAVEAIGNRMVGSEQTSRPTPQQSQFPPLPDPIPAQVDYAAKEREKVLGMCFTNLLSGRLSNTPAIELEKDLGEIAAIWRLAAMCIDGTGRVEEETRF